MAQKKGYKMTEEHKKKLAVAKMGILNPAKREDVRKKISESKLGQSRVLSKIHKENISKALSGKSKTLSHRVSLKNSWEDSNRRNKTVSRSLIKRNFKITPSEKVLSRIIKSNNLPFNYVGDGKVVLNGFCPDFLSKNPKQIIELFGSWHSSKNCVERDKRRLRAYSSLGYKTLIIWNNELDDEIGVVNKIKEFLR